MKLTEKEIHAKHQEGVEEIFKYFCDLNFNPHKTSSNDEDIKDDRFCRLSKYYDQYVSIANGMRRPYPRYGRKTTQEYIDKETKRAKNFILKYPSKRKYIDSFIDKPSSLDYKYIGDIQYYCKDWNTSDKVYVKVANSTFLRRAAVYDSKCSYIVMCNLDEVGKSRIILRSHAVAYFEGIVSREKWLQMPFKRRNAVFQNFDKFENYCYLEDFIMSETTAALLNSDKDIAREDIKKALFIKRNHEKQTK